MNKRPFPDFNNNVNDPGADHTHQIDTSSNPGAARAIVATDPDGGITLAKAALAYAEAIIANAAVGNAGSLTLDPEYVGDGIVATVSLNAGGTGYAVDDVLTVVQAGGVGCTVTVTSVAATVVDGVSLTTGGTGYTVAAGLATTVSPAGGTGCTIDIDTLTARTIAAHAYVELNDPEVSHGAAVTAAPVLNLDGAIGTHLATLASFDTTDSGAHTTTWAGGLQIMIDGTLYKIPFIAV